jgi:hypothetical protein
MMKKTLLLLIFVTTQAFAFVCEQSETVPLENAHEQTTQLAQKFSRIDHLEVLPNAFTQTGNQHTLTTVQIFICGELIPQTPKLGTIQGQACNFDSSCIAPMRCQNNVCTLPQ